MLRLLAILWISALAATAAPKRVAVFVALCDNRQGIAPVPARIGDGDKLEDNLYWGCSESLPSVLSASKNWKLTKKETPEDTRILERRIYTDTAGTVEITVDGWRGTEIVNCVKAFDQALLKAGSDLYIYIGHNALMNNEIPAPTGHVARPVDAMVLCCQSEPFFKARLNAIGARPVLLTTQFMYPGGFLVRDSIGPWAKGKPLADLRAAAGAAYAANQKISNKAGLGVFSVLP